MVQTLLLKRDWSGLMVRSHGRKSIPSVLIGFGRHLVYAEGTKTEPLYVADLKHLVATKLCIDERFIEIVPVTTNKTRHTSELVNFAFKDVCARRKKGETIDYVWIFYDKDSFDDFDDAYRIIMNFNNKHNEDDGAVSCDMFDTSWNACWSNECFEVWAYHYFESLNTPLSRDDYIKKINQFLKRNGCKSEYSKNHKRLHSFLEENGGSLELAIKLMKAKDNKEFIKPNPSSGVYLFAEYIQAYLSKDKGNK